MSSTPDKYGLKNNNHLTNLPSLSFILPVIILSLYTTSTWADQPSQPIQISADNAQSSNGLGQTIYQGNVMVKQGSLLLLGDMVIVNVFNDNDSEAIEDNYEPDSAIKAFGKPALFHQLNDNNIITVKAEANKIEYFVESGIIRLQDNATIDQAGYIVTGDKIEYSTQMQSIKANANPEDKNTRVHTVIKPKPSNEDTP